MHVAYIGNFALPWCTEVHVARTFEQLGHRVTRLQENGFSPAALSHELVRLIGNDKPDVMWFTRTWGATVTLDHLAMLRQAGIPSIAHHLDLYVGLARGGARDPKSAARIGDDPFWRCDVVFSPDGDPRSAEVFARSGINHRYLKPGVVEDECWLADVPLECDVIFVGSRQYHPEWPYRPELIDWLERTYGPRFQWHGRPGEPVRGADLNRLYASTRVVVGDSLVLNFDHQGYSSDRRYETPGRGGFMIHPWIDGINDGFEDGVNTAFYRFGDFAGLKDRIDYYLAHDDERERIRLAGHEHVRANHTYHQRLTAALDLLRTEGAIS